MTVDPEAVRAMAAAYTAARNSGSPQAVAAFYAPHGQTVINRGEPWVGRQRIGEMAAGLFADVSDLNLVCNDLRCAANHVAYFWTFAGTRAATKSALRVAGWEERDLDPGLKVIASRGWYDAADCERQTTAR